MNADQIMSQFTVSFSSGMHKTRANRLEACVRSAISGQRLTVTDLGHAIGRLYWISLLEIQDLSNQATQYSPLT